MDKSLCSFWAKNAIIIMLLEWKIIIILPPDIEPKVNLYKLSNTWIKTPLSDGLWNYDEINFEYW